jgi:hypothetical protein
LGDLAAIWHAPAVASPVASEWPSAGFKGVSLTVP